MTKRNIGNEIINSMQEAVKYMRGKKTRAITHKIKIPENKKRYLGLISRAFNRF